MRRAGFRGLLACFVSVLSASAQSAIPTRTAVRDVVIDGTAADLSSVGAIMLARNGSIAVAQPQDHHIRFFDERGAPLGIVGRDGAGPGEFRAIARLGWRGDTLWVYDRGLSRLTLMSPQRKVLRTIPVVRTVLDRDPTSAPVQILDVAALYADRTQLLVTFLPRERPAWARAALDAGSRVVLPRVTPDGAVTHLAGWAPEDPCGLDLSALNTNCARPLAAVSPDGDRIAFLTMATVGADSGQFRLTLLTAEGDTVLGRRFPFTARAIPARITDSLRAVDAKRPQPPLPPGTEARLGTPKIFPPVRGVVLGRDGTVLISHRPVGTSAQHLLLSPTGQSLGMVTLPANVKVQAVGRTVLWGTVADEYGLESIVRYRIR